jgi:hypothetical protein
MTKIVAFAGRKQSGKTTCSEFVKSICSEDKDVRIYNFADPLKKDICMTILGLSYDQCYGDDDAKNTTTNIQWEGKFLTAREVMQFVGTDIFRKMLNSVWADATINRIKNDKPDLAIIADCRFPNEVDVVRSAGGIVVKLTRNPFNSEHASEIALDANNYDPRNFDIIITNHLLEIPHQNEVVYRFLKKKGILPL